MTTTAAQKKNQSTPVQPQCHPAFKWLRSERIDSLNVTIEEYRHI